MTQLTGAFSQLFFANALQMIQRLHIVGLTETKQDGKAIPHFRELPMLRMQNKRVFQDISSRDRQAQLSRALQPDKLALSQDRCAAHWFSFARIKSPEAWQCGTAACPRPQASL
jgi:hypothetical protein